MTRPEETDPFEDPAHDEVRALLADLGSVGSHPPGPVPDDVAARLDAALADLPRRRWSPRLLVAAAVVVVIGAGGVTATLAVRDAGTVGDTSAGGAASSAESEDAGVPALTRAGLAAQAERLLTGPPAGARRPGGTALAAGCATPPGRGDLVDVRFEGRPAVLAARPARRPGGPRVVEVWACDGARVLARTRVAAPGERPPD